MNNPLIVIPTYNEERHLPTLMTKLSPYKEICLFVNDGSTDHTSELIKAGGFMEIDCSVNMGVSKAIMCGIDYALGHNFDRVILMDADGQHDPTFLPSFISALEDNDAVLGNRFTEESLPYIPTCKIASNLFASKVIEQVVGVFVPDVSCGFKGFRLTADLVDFLANSTDFSVIYRLVYYILTRHCRFANVQVSPDYYYDSLLYTRASELKSLIATSLEVCNSLEHKETIRDWLAKLMIDVNKKMDCFVGETEVPFSLFFLPEYQGYIMQAPAKSMYLAYKCER